MAHHLGRELLIKRATNTPNEFAHVVGIATRQFTINNESVTSDRPNATDPTSVADRVTRAGPQSIAVTGSGPFNSVEAAKLTIADSITQAEHVYQIIVPGLGTFTGPMLVISASFDGDLSNDLQFSIDLRNAAKLAFTAEV